MQLQGAKLKKGDMKMGWKEIWETYQVAAVFAEAGEHEAARSILEEGSKVQPSQEKQGHTAHDPRRGRLRPSHAEG
jgi:hypothetical protein